MATKRILLAANTWTDITTQVKEVGEAVIVRAEVDDISLGLVVTGETPTDAPALAQYKGYVVIVKAETTDKVWAHSTAGGFLQVDKFVGGAIFDNTGVTSAV